MPETIFRLPDTDITIVDGGLYEEPPGLSDVTCILYVVNLAGHGDAFLRRDDSAVGFLSLLQC
jgi:hypothetical protein